MSRSRSPGALQDYSAKRDFAATPEPPPGPVRRRADARSGRFLVQKHAATRLHYDFRLEIDGVLKSWAITRGPSRDPADKRLAVRTEDHPLAYASFEGTIPEGHYGAGTVMLWDEGTFRVEGPSAAQALAEGKLHLHLSGERLMGEWTLVRIRGRPKETRENWLFIAVRPEGPAEDPTARHLTSIRSGRSMQQIEGGQTPPKPKRRAGGDAAPPPFQPFQLCGQVEAAPDGPGWIHEIKHDGYRAQLAVGGGRARIHLRSGSDATDRLPLLAEAGAALTQEPHLLDGELVVQDAEGRSSFGALQKALADEATGEVLFMAFDLLVADGRPITSQPLLHRKALLKDLLGAPNGPIRFSDHIEDAGPDVFRTACETGLEGIISKRADTPYRGRRSNDWVKVKCLRAGRFQVIGWLPSSSRIGFRSLLLARENGANLLYAGKVGTGFTTAGMAALAERLQALETDRPPVPVLAVAARGARWVKPGLAGDVGYAEITADGVLRHARWLGEAEGKTAMARTPSPARSAPAAPRISNRDRIIFPAIGGTKGDLADYVQAMAPHILVHAARRPLSLVRCPEGVGGDCFFQKHAGPGFDAVRQTRADSKGQRWIYVDDAAGLLACVQMGSIEFHGWGSRVGSLDNPDRLVIDLDPDEALPFADTVAAARHIRDLLADMGLVTFPMLSGGKGIHVIAPLDGSCRWPAVKDFARRFALALETADPDRFVATARKSGRTGRIFVDWLRNQKGATAVLPWSARARPEASVAVPLDWAALDRATASNAWSITDRDALQQLAADQSGWGQADQPLPAI